MDRVILHSDLNNFYASVECLYNPDIRDKPVAVGGDEKLRHGIVLAKNYIAKKYGVKTGETLWQARQKCPDIIFVPPNFQRYIKYSRIAKEIYSEYTNKVESFGLDECWIDVSQSGIFGDGVKIADEIRNRIKFELGVTASIGVSFNKIFAKLGSDIKKPDATTVISRDNFKEIVWRLPVNELLYVGRATNKKLKNYGINTIGDLAKTDISILKYMFGKNGQMLWLFANGMDTSPVSGIEVNPLIKSIGNSITAPKDLISDNDIKITFLLLCESVAERLRDQNFICKTVQITIRDNELFVYERQGKLFEASCSSKAIFDMAYKLFKENPPNKPVRSLGVRACNLTLGDERQISFLPDLNKMQKHESLELAVDNIRRRFGHFSLQRGIMLLDKPLSNLDPKAEHTIFPVSFLK